MKSKILLATVLLMTLNISGQTLIATSNNPNATANHNQRKIVRDYENVYVVFKTFENQEFMIKGVMFSFDDGEWSAEIDIANGNNPTLAISPDGKIHLIYESNDVAPQIMHTASEDFINWLPAHELSGSVYPCRVPVADIDSDGILNVFWIEDVDEMQDNLVYSSVSNDTIVETRFVCAKEEIVDVAVANHLQYYLNDLFFAIAFNEDSIQFFHSMNYLDSFDTLYQATGTMPCITYNSIDEFMMDEGLVRLLYIDEFDALIEFEYMVEFGSGWEHQLPVGLVDYVCIDDISPPIGHSFLYMQNGYLKHGFSYGSMFSWYELMETISGNGISNPSIAYKHFNPLYVDFIWMEEWAQDFNIYHMQDEKHVFMPQVPEPSNEWGFSVSGRPNPFSEQIVLQVNVENANKVPIIEIYNTNSQLINELKPFQSNDNSYKYLWDGASSNGDIVKPGIYIVLCTQGDNRHASKIVYQP